MIKKHNILEKKIKSTSEMKGKESVSKANGFISMILEFTGSF